MSTDPNQPPRPDPNRQPTEEEMRAALQEELKRVRVDQVVLEAAISILNISVMRAGLVPDSGAEPDPEQVRIGIEAVRGLLPVVEQIAGEQARPIRDALSQLQMAYVRAMEDAERGGEAGEQAGAGAAGGPGTEGGQPGQPRPGRQQPGEGQPGPAQQSGRLWVPGQ